MLKQMCQSCGIPLNDKNKGTEASGALSEKYCQLCYSDGRFNDPKLTVEELQEAAYKALRKKHWPNFLAKMATNNIPKLERWKK